MVSGAPKVGRYKEIEALLHCSGRLEESVVSSFTQHLKKRKYFPKPKCHNSTEYYVDTPLTSLDNGTGK